jgi:hypothetical protein
MNTWCYFKVVAGWLTCVDGVRRVVSVAYNAPFIARELQVPKSNSSEVWVSAVIVLVVKAIYFDALKELLANYWFRRPYDMRDVNVFGATRSGKSRSLHSSMIDCSLCSITAIYYTPSFSKVASEQVTSNRILEISPSSSSSSSSYFILLLSNSTPLS